MKFFPWLENCEKLFGFNNLKGYGLTRIYGFLAERFMSYWFKKMQNIKNFLFYFTILVKLIEVISLNILNNHNFRKTLYFQSKFCYLSIFYLKLFLQASNFKSLPFLYCRYKGGSIIIIINRTSIEPRSTST